MDLKTKSMKTKFQHKHKNIEGNSQIDLDRRDASKNGSSLRIYCEHAIIFVATILHEPLTDEDMTVPHDLWHALVERPCQREIATVQKRDLVRKIAQFGHNMNNRLSPWRYRIRKT